MKRFFAYFTLSILASSGILLARSLNETALFILKESPEFKTQNLSLASFEASARLDGNLPDPQIDGEYLVAPADESDRWGAELSWSLEWPGVYNARAKEAAQRIEATRLALRAERLAQLTQIKTILLDYILCKKKLALLEELEINTDSIFRLSEKAAQGGEITALDLNKARLEYANIRVAKAAHLNDQASYISDLSEYLGFDASPLLSELEIEFPQLYTPSSDELAALNHISPSVKAALAQAEVAVKNKRVAKMSALPSLSVGYKHAYEDGMHFNGALLGVSIPIFSSRGKSKAAQAALSEAQFKAEAEALKNITEIELLVKKLSLIKFQIEEISPIIRGSDHNDILLKAYTNGLISMLDYLAERNYFTNANNELLSLQHDAAVTQAQLEEFTSAVDF